MFVTFGEQKCFCNQFVVGHGHDDGTEELLEIVGQFLSSTIAFASRIERNEDARVLVQIDLQIYYRYQPKKVLYSFAEEVACLAATSQSILDGLDLHGDGGQYCFFQTVELVEAAPGAALDQAGEDASHGANVNALIAVEDEHLSTEKTSQSFDRLCFSGSSRAIGVATQSHQHG